MAGSIRVLHVEDDAEFARVAGEFLERENDRFVVETATSAEAGLERLSESPVDCIVSDYEMPGADGIEFLDAVRADYPELPFILFTGKGSEEVASEAVSAGVTEYLQKETGTDQYTLLANRIINAVEGFRTARNLERERDRLEAVFETVPYPISHVRFTDDGHVVESVNSAFLDTFGLERADVEGRSLDSVIVPPGSEDEATEIDRRVRAGEDVRREVERRTAEGVQEFLFRAHRLETGETTEGIGVYVDITDQKRRQRKLETQNAKIKELHRVATEIRTCRSEEAVYDRVVEAAEGILEFDIAIADAAVNEVLVPRAVSSEMSAGEYYDETSVYADDSLAAEAYRQAEPSLVDHIQEVRDAAPADPEFRSLLTVPIGDHGIFQSAAREPAAFDERDLELTELLVAHARAQLDQLSTRQRLRRRTEELERQSERIDRFASFVSHDLRNPLGVAEGRLELAMLEDDGSLEEHLDAVDGAHDRMRGMIEDLLALAREEETTTDYESVALSDLTERCWASVETGGANLEVAADHSIRADPDRLRRLVENLLRNAVEHGGAGVDIRVGELGEADGFYLEDDGEGIPEGERDRVFEPAYSTAPDGTGFGLSIVEEIATDHDWTVTVAEGADGGARFEFSGVELLE